MKELRELANNSCSLVHNGNLWPVKKRKTVRALVEARRRAAGEVVAEDETEGKAVDAVRMLKEGRIKKLTNIKSNVSSVMYMAIMPQNVGNRRENVQISSRNKVRMNQRC